MRVRNLLRLYYIVQNVDSTGNNVASKRRGVKVAILLCSLFCAFDFFCFGELNDSFELVKYGEATNRYREKVENLNIPHIRTKAPQQKKICNVSKV